jgi:4-hydroxy-tetrahydrodipicolinate synthase
LRAQGLPAGPVRSPLVDATTEELSQLRADAVAAGLTL